MNATLTDEELIRLYFPSQSRYCIEILYQRYHQTIYHQCLKLTRNAQQAQDFSQDVFIKVLLKLGTFQQRSRFSTARRPGWLYAIAHNYCRDQIRLGKRLPTTGLEEYREASPMDQPDCLVYEEMMRQFSHTLGSLTEAEQTLLRLKYEQALILSELATQFGLSLSAVKMRLKRSRDKIQRCYANPVPG